MPINSIDNFIASSRQDLRIMKTTTRTSVANIPFSVFDIAWAPGAGVLAGTSTTAWVVPTDATAGTPLVNAFGAWATWYITSVEFSNTVSCRMTLFDMLFKSGAYAFTAGTTTLSAQPSYSSRVPAAGTDFTNTEIWIEVSTAFVTGTAWQVQVTYTNQSGTTGRTSIISAAQAAAALTLGKMFQIALQAGDTWVQKIESVIVTNGGTAMTAGNFNVLVLRRITIGRIRVANDLIKIPLLQTGMPIVYADSAFYLQVTADSTSTGLPECYFQVANL